MFDFYGANFFSLSYSGGNVMFSFLIDVLGRIVYSIFLCSGVFFSIVCMRYGCAPSFSPC